MAWGSIKNYRREPLPCAGALEAEHQKAGSATKDTIATTTDPSEKSAPQKEKAVTGK